MLKKLQVFLVTLVVVSVTATGVFCLYFLAWYSEKVNEQLLVSACEMFMREYVNTGDYEDAGDACEAVFKPSAGALRITVINVDGTVLYDNEQDASTMENHASRQEVKQAISTRGSATIKRYSNTLGLNMLYLARYYEDSNLVIRTSIPLTMYQQGVRQLQTSFAVIIGLSLVLAAALSFWYTKRVSRPLINLRNAAETMADANYSVRVPVLSDDEIGSVSRAFNSMADQLEKEVSELGEQNTRLAMLQEMRSEFVANVSHELKTPLTSIRGFVDTLRSGNVTDPAVRDRFLEIIDIEAERLSQLINDILQLSEIEKMETETELQKFDLAALLDDVATLLDEKASEHRVSIIVEDCEKLPVLASLYRVKQVLINLVDNAIKYNKEGGRIYISATREPDRMVAIRVRDTGEGIASEHIPRIFERFYRVDKSHSREMGGTGLGLSIVKHIAQLYDGSASVESKPGVGSTFVVRLRIADDLN